MGTGWASLAAEQPFAERGSRSSDTEPNDSSTTASPIASGDVVEGSLKNTSTSDNTDFYRIQGGVSPCQVITATLYHVDYDESNPSRINFNVSIQYLYYGYYMWSVSTTYGTNRTETAIYLQTVKFDGPEQFWVCVAASAGSEAGRYELTVNVSDPPELPTGQVSGYLHNRTGPQAAYYKLGALPDNAGVRLRLQCPAGAIFYLNINNIWPPRNEWWYQNASKQDTAGCLQEAHFVGMGGAYYVSVTTPSYYYAGGNGTFILTADMFGGPEDGDNFPASASVVNSNSPYAGSVASGTDTADWYRVDMKAGRPLAGAAMYSPNLPYYNYINFSAFDKDLKFLKSGAASYGYANVDLGSFTTNYTGPLYFAVRAGSNYYGYIYGGSGGYKLNFMLPNDPPQLNGSLPAVVMDEDTSDSSLVLSNFVWDPDGNHINYTLFGSKYNTTPVVDRDSGRVNFTPIKNWWGMETVKFIARDDGPDQKMIVLNTTVTVNPVNDLPTVAALAKDGTVTEEQSWRTADLATIFSDVDDVHSNLTFGCRLASSETHPPGAQLPVKYDPKNRCFVLGPAHLFWGDFEFELNCTDNHPGTVPAATRFNLSVSHVNHEPSLRENVPNPYPITVQERGTNPELLLDALFTDPDGTANYADDRLTFTVTGMNKLNAAIGTGRNLVISAGTEQYRPGFPGMETLTVVATDKAGASATLQVLVTVEPVNDAPTIISSQPGGATVAVKEGEKKAFSVSISDVDTDGAAITYTWYLDGVLDAGVKEASYNLAADYTMGGRDHKVRVDVFDGNNTVSKEWTVTVGDVNRLPEGAIKTPLNFTKYVKGAIVTFTADGADPDGDALTFIWKDQTGAEMGRGPTFTYNKLLKGMQTISLDISDGKGTTTRYVTIEVKDQTPQAKTPGFELAVLCAAVCISTLIALSRRKW